MKQETEKFITKVEQKFKSGQVSITEFDSLIKEWGQLIAINCYEQHNMKQTYLNLNHLRFTVQWFKQQYSSKNSNQLQDFLEYLIKYVSVELKSLTIHPIIKEDTSEINGTQSKTAIWTTHKRSLIELISALHDAKCINKGNITLQKLVVLFEALFGVNLKNYHSELNKMASRKPLNNNHQRAYFLNELSNSFNDKVLHL